ncbi:MAG: SHOCT domain-containing protein [Gammaproteobacteria bacterium]
MNGYGYGMGWMGYAGGFLMLVFWILVIILLVALVRGAFNWHAPHHDEKPRSNRALEILEERYARGEIEREEFESKRHDLLNR